MGSFKTVGLPNEGSFKICQSFEGRGNESLSFRVARNLIHLTSAWQREKTVTRATTHSQMGVFGSGIARNETAPFQGRAKACRMG